MSREEQFEALADTLGEASFAYNEFDPSDEATTCIKRGTSVDEVAEYLIAAGFRKLSLDDATVERALEALLFAMYGPGGGHGSQRDSWRSTARSVLAAAVEAGQ